MKDSPAVLPSPSLSFANRMRQARTHAGLTKAELARRVGVCLSAVVQWEHPRGTVPNATNLARAAQVTDVAFEWLATGRGPARLSASDGPPAIEPTAIASTLFEERLLQISRLLPSHQHEPLLEFLVSVTKKTR